MEHDLWEICETLFEILSNHEDCLSEEERTITKKLALEYFIWIQPNKPEVEEDD